ncbi:hypothetical protein K4R10_04525 [Staphylococcus epidermidis]|nr:hypothetical protein [Staphylococcus epidermidis]
MKKIAGFLLIGIMVISGCGYHNQNDGSKHDKEEKSMSTNKDMKSDNKDKSNDSSSYDNQQTNSDYNNTTTSNEAESVSKNDNGITQSNNSNHEQPQSKQIQESQQNNNGYMTQDEINEWNKNKPTTHDESQMGYGRGDYEQALKESQKVWNDPNAHVGGPRWVGKNEGYESWAKRQQEVQNSVAE